MNKFKVGDKVKIGSLSSWTQHLAGQVGTILSFDRIYYRVEFDGMLVEVTEIELVSVLPEGVQDYFEHWDHQSESAATESKSEGDKLLEFFFGLKTMPKPKDKKPMPECDRHDWMEVVLFNVTTYRCVWCDTKKP